MGVPWSLLLLVLVGALQVPFFSFSAFQLFSFPAFRAFQLFSFSGIGDQELARS